MYYVGKVFKSWLIDLEQEPMEDVQSGCSQESQVNDKSSPLAKRVTPIGTANKAKSIEEKLKEVQEDINLARIREEHDFAANVKKEDPVVISGLTCKFARPSGQVEARKWIQEIIGNAVDLIVPDSSGKSQFFSQSRSKASNVLMCEVKFRES